MSVFFIKLVTGDELLAEVEPGPDRLRMIEPMTVEYGETEDGRRFVLVSRYCQFVKVQQIDLELDKIVFMEPVMDEMISYYQKSLDHTRENADKAFREGIIKTISGGDADEDQDLEEISEDVEEIKTLH